MNRAKPHGPSDLSRAFRSHAAALVAIGCASAVWSAASGSLSAREAETPWQATPGPGGPVRLATRDGMVQRYVPAGSFSMGSNTDPDAGADETPQRRIALDGFWIDQTEVTNGMYQRFVTATGYRTQAELAGYSYGFVAEEFVPIQGATWRSPRGTGSTLQGLADHPVVALGWQDADAYCRWAGRRLPTEAEWERAARGQLDYRYPWGDEPVTAARANFADRNADVRWRDAASDDGFARTAPTGAFPAGASPVGTLDMAGNAWEWVADWYDPAYYRYGSTTNPRGPESGVYRVIRGGSYADSATAIRSARRTFDDANHTSIESGFRCAQSERTFAVLLPILARPPSPTPMPTPTATATHTPVTPTPTATPRPPIDPCAPIPDAPAYAAISRERAGDGRPAHEHPDVNLSIRGWEPTGGEHRLIDIDGPHDPRAPRLYHLLPDSDYGSEHGTFTSLFRVYDWYWTSNIRGPVLTEYGATLVGMKTTQGQTVHVPWADYSIGRLEERTSMAHPCDASAAEYSALGDAAPLQDGYNVLVLYATRERITFTYTRHDTVACGYVIHVENVCVEPRLRELYERMNREGRSRLPALRAHEPFGRALGGEILVAIRDTGTFMDPRSRKDWWR